MFHIEEIDQEIETEEGEVQTTVVMIHTTETIPGNIQSQCFLWFKVCKITLLDLCVVFCLVKLVCFFSFLGNYIQEIVTGDITSHMKMIHITIEKIGKINN